MQVNVEHRSAPHVCRVVLRQNRRSSRHADRGRKKFTPTFHNLQILGLCDSCRRKGEQPDAPDRVKMIGQGAMTLRK